MRDEKGTFIDYAEVRCDYLDEDDGFWRVDAWEIGDDDEEGEVVAYVHDGTGDCVVTEPLARLSKLVKEAIEAKRAEIRAREERQTDDGAGETNVAFAPDDEDDAAIAVFRVTAAYRAPVHRDEWDAMAREATSCWENADFGVAENVDAELLWIETPQGDLIPKDAPAHTVAFEMAKAFRRSEPNWKNLTEDELKALLTSFRDHMLRYEGEMTFEEAEIAWKDYGALVALAERVLGTKISPKVTVFPWEE